MDNPTTLTLDDLRAMPAVERVVTLECAGNGRLRQTPLPAGEPWGRLAVSTARWRGRSVPGARTGAPGHQWRRVKFEGADHGRYQQYGDLTFVRSLALEHATDAVAEILIAYEMNGEPLNADHGKPFRLIVPRWYGVASVKWLKRIEVTTEPFQGEFEARHYMYEWADRPSEPVTVMPVQLSCPTRHRAPAVRRVATPVPRKGLVRVASRDRGPYQPDRRRGLAPGQP